MRTNHEDNGRTDQVREHLTKYLERTLEHHDGPVIRQAKQEIATLLRGSRPANPGLRPKVPNLAESLRASAEYYAIKVLRETKAGPLAVWHANAIGHDLMAIAQGREAKRTIGYYAINHEQYGIRFTD